MLNKFMDFMDELDIDAINGRPGAGVTFWSIIISLGLAGLLLLIVLVSAVIAFPIIGVPLVVSVIGGFLVYKFIQYNNYRKNKQ